MVNDVVLDLSRMAAVEIATCPRCELTHTMHWREIKNNPGAFDAWTQCPTTDEPIVRIRSGDFEVRDHYVSVRIREKKDDITAHDKRENSGSGGEEGEGGEAE